jgi:preprotein translocase subunit SecD
MYVEALTSLETWKAVPVRVLASNGGRLNERVARLLGVPSCARGFSTTVGLAFLCLIVAAGIATAQNNATTSIPGFAIRIVDGSVEKNARQGPPGEDRVRTSTTDKNIPAALWLKRDGQIVGGVLADAHAGAGRNGEPVVEFTLTPEGRDQFAALTRANIGHSLAVVVNGTIVTVPVVKEPMIDGKGEISGHFTESQAGALAVEMMGTKPPASP